MNTFSPFSFPNKTSRLKQSRNLRGKVFPSENSEKQHREKEKTKTFHLIFNILSHHDECDEMSKKEVGGDSEEFKKSFFGIPQNNKA